MSCIAAAVGLGTPASALALAPVSSFGTFGKAPGQISWAGGLAIAADGLIYVADEGNSRIDVFAPNGGFIQSLGKVINAPEECKKDTPCNETVGRGSAGAVSSPSDVAIDPEGNIVVADPGNGRVSIFSPGNVFLLAFGKGVNPAGGDVCTEATGCNPGAETGSPGALSLPLGIDVDSKGEIFVTDTGNNRVDVFSATGKYLRSIGKEVVFPPSNCKKDQPCPKPTEAEVAGAMESPSDVVVDASGQIAVADAGNHRIDVFAPDGAFVRAFGKGVRPSGGDVCTGATGCKSGSISALAGGLASPSTLIMSSSGSLYVADSSNHRINEFAFDGALIRAFGAGVVDGASAFQICTTATGCRAGIAGTIPGAVSNPSGIATDCTGAIYAVELYSAYKDAPISNRVERFAETKGELPPCLPPAPPSPTLSEPEPPPIPPPPVPLPADLTPPPPIQPHVVMKPRITLELNQGSGTAVLIVVVGEPGTLLLKGKGIRTVKRRTKGAGSIELLVQPKGGTLRKLQETGKAIVKTSLTFEPDKGTSITQIKSVALKMATQF